MPISPTYPGVYIEEVPSGVRTIVGVATSITAFVGNFSRGPMNEATQIFNPGDFEREFGGLRADSEASYAIDQFFLNGGGEAWVVRTAGAGSTAAGVRLGDKATSPSALLLATAATEGAWGDRLRVEVDYDTADPTSSFNLMVTEVAETPGSPPVAVETFRNLTLDPSLSSYAVDVVNGGSRLIQLQLESGASATARPAQSGTVSDPITDVAGLGLADADDMDISLDGGTPAAVTLGSPVPSSLASLASVLQARIRATSVAPNATVSVVGSTSTDGYLQIQAGTGDPGAVLTCTGGQLSNKLGIDSTDLSNVQQYALGGGDAGAQMAPSGGQQGGAEGGLPDAAALTGNELQKTGLYALDDVDTINVLSIPDTMRLSDSEAAVVASEAEAYCLTRRSFYLLDVPHSATNPRDEVDEIKAWLDQNGSLRHTNAALYFPRPQVADPLQDFRPRAVAPSGTLAGLYARTDSNRGVWKAPAGTEATLRGVQALEAQLTDPENGTLNPLAINCLRSFPTYGNVSWGARTLVGSDQQASEWKYVPVRRFALFLEESLYRGLQWVVFEPNDEPLWSQVRLNVGAFMQNLFRQGAFQGQTPKEAYLVKCDAETTTQNDIDQGIVNIVVGFAPLKPAEFVIIKIQQLAGQIQA